MFLRGISFLFEVCNQLIGLAGHDVCSFDELSRQLRRQDAVLLGWNRRADEVVDFGDSSFEAVARTSSSSSEKDIGSQSSVSANVNPTKGAADAAHGDANLLRRRKPRTHKGPSLHALRHPASVSLQKLQEFTHGRMSLHFLVYCRATAEEATLH